MNRSVVFAVIDMAKTKQTVKTNKNGQAASNPYLLRDDTQYCICISGGRSSGYMLRKILDANGGIPDNAICIFNNTGKEREETLVFVNEMATQWGVDIVWLEYWFDSTAKGVKGAPKVKHRVVAFDTCSRMGEPFEAMIKNKQYLPNVVHRICTAQLKIGTTERYLRRQIGWKGWRDIVGIRGDERSRAERMIKSRCTIDAPMFWAKVDKDEIGDYWKNNNFDLGINSAKSNCDACFLKARSDIIQTFKNEPTRAAWWIKMENLVRKNKRAEGQSINQFRKDKSMAELLDMAMHDDVPVNTTDAKVDCFCGD